MNHKLITHKDCEIQNCLICDGGLAICSVCGGAEGALTTDCPGIQLESYQLDSIHNGDIDFINEKWIEL